MLAAFVWTILFGVIAYTFSRSLAQAFDLPTPWQTYVIRRQQERYDAEFWHIVARTTESI